MLISATTEARRWTEPSKVEPFGTRSQQTGALVSFLTANVKQSLIVATVTGVLIYLATVAPVIT